MTDVKVLIVDDQPDLMAGFQVRLENEGYEVLTARSGASALSIAKDQQPVITILEHRFEGEITGISLAEKLLSSHNIPSIFYTGVTDCDYVKAATAVGAIGYLIKDASLDVVIGQVNTAIRARLDIIDSQRTCVRLEQRIDVRAKTENLVGMYSAIWGEPVSVVRSQLNRFARSNNLTLEQLADMNDAWHHEYAEMHRSFQQRVNTLRPKTLGMLDKFHCSEASPPPQLSQNDSISDSPAVKSLTGRHS